MKKYVIIGLLLTVALILFYKRPRTWEEISRISSIEEVQFIGVDIYTNNKDMPIKKELKLADHDMAKLHEMMEENKYRRVWSKRYHKSTMDDSFGTISYYYIINKDMISVSMYVDGTIMIDNKAYNLAKGQRQSTEKVQEIYEYVQVQDKVEK